MPENSPDDSPKIADLKRRLAADPSSRLFLDLAREYHEAGLLEKAADVCARGLRRHPTYLSARVLLGRVLFDMGRVDEACEAMETALSQAPDNLIARRVLAEIRLEQGDVPGALDRFRALLAFNPTDLDTKKRIDELEARLKAGAAATSKVATEEDGDLEPGVLATPTLAEIYLQQGLVEKAARVYHLILKGDPSNVEALSRLAEIEPSAPAPSDPATVGRHRKIHALTSWLDVIRGCARIRGSRV